MEMGGRTRTKAPQNPNPDKSMRGKKTRTNPTL